MMDVTDIWRDYERGKKYFDSQGYFAAVEECHRMVYGDQWEGVKTGEERPAQLNILAPIMKSSTALVGQNLMQIIYHSMNYDSNREMYTLVCDQLNKLAERTWEKAKMDAYSWQCLEDAFVGGDAFLYFRADTKEKRLNPIGAVPNDVKITVEPIDCVNAMLADEQNPVVNEQPYLILVQRRYVKDVKREAEENGVKKDQLSLILPDKDTDLQLNGDTEVENQLKLTTLIKMWLDKDGLHVARATKHVIYQPEYVIPGMTVYPIAKYSWSQIKGKARGEGGIKDKIPNQLSINKNLYRFEAAVKSSAFPIKAYNNQALSPSDVKALSVPDTAVGLQDVQSQGIDKLISYVQPASISAYAVSVWQDLITLTRDLSGAGDNLENVNPEQASGTAIQAAREAKELNVNAQTAAYKQFIEDIAVIWFELWKAYSPNGLVVVTEENGEETQTIIPGDILSDLMVDIKIDVSPTNPYSKVAKDMALKELMDSQAITFDEFVDVLSDDSTFPKKKLQKIIEDRQKQADLQAKLQEKMMGGMQNGLHNPQGNVPVAQV